MDTKHTYISPEDLWENFSTTTETIWVKKLIIETCNNLVKLTWLNDQLCCFSGFTITVDKDKFKSSLETIKDSLNKDYCSTSIESNISENYRADFVNNRYIDRQINNFFISFIKDREMCITSFCCNQDLIKQIIDDFNKDNQT